MNDFDDFNDLEDGEYDIEGLTAIGYWNGQNKDMLGDSQ